MRDIITADTAEERATIGHIRGWCHDSTECRVCAAERRAYAAERAFTSVIEG